MQYSPLAIARLRRARQFTAIRHYLALSGFEIFQIARRNSWTLRLSKCSQTCSLHWIDDRWIVLGNEEAEATRLARWIVAGAVANATL